MSTDELAGIGKETDQHPVAPECRKGHRQLNHLRALPAGP